MLKEIISLVLLLTDWFWSWNLLFSNFSICYPPYPASVILSYGLQESLDIFLSFLTFIFVIYHLNCYLFLFSQHLFFCVQTGEATRPICLLWKPAGYQSYQILWNHLQRFIVTMILLMLVVNRCLNLKYLQIHQLFKTKTSSGGLLVNDTLMHLTWARYLTWLTKN